MRFVESPLDEATHHPRMRLDQRDNLRIFRGLGHFDPLLGPLDFHRDLGRLLEQRPEQRVPEPQTTAFLQPLLHRDHMLLDLRRDLGVVRLGHGLHSRFGVLHRTADVVVVFQQVVEDLHVVAHLPLWTSAPHHAAPHTPARTAPRPPSRLGQHTGGNQQHQTKRTRQRACHGSTGKISRVGVVVVRKETRSGKEWSGES